MKRFAFVIPAICALTAGTAQAQDVGAGEDLYMEFCASCHGLDAMGDGPMAGVLMVPPTDLTVLQADNDGVFPMERIARRIDGRDPLVSHGSPMPVYGHFFEGADATIKTPSGQPMLTSQPIVDLLAYLESLQDN